MRTHSKVFLLKSHHDQIACVLLAVSSISRKYISMGEHDDKGIKFFPLIYNGKSCQNKWFYVVWKGKGLSGEASMEGRSHLNIWKKLCIYNAYICITVFVLALGPFSILNDSLAWYDLSLHIQSILNREGILCRAIDSGRGSTHG